MKETLYWMYYSFPIQLVILHFKKDHILLFAWLFFVVLITGTSGFHYGILYLYLDPEYLGKVNFLSFLFVGIALGGFIVTWNITSYIINSYRFPFLASLEYPLWHYSINNFIIPTAFVVFYAISIIRFQFVYELKVVGIIMFRVGGMLSGIMLVMLLTALYFNLTNTSILSFLRENKNNKKKYTIRRDKSWTTLVEREPMQKVEYFMSTRLKLRAVRDVSHYNESLLLRVFQQHHKNAFLIQLVTLAVLVVLGFFIDYPVFQIPAAASIFLLASIIIVVAGAVNYWLGSWRVTLFILIVLIANYFTGYEFFSHKNEVYGINYNTTQAEYSLTRLDSLSNESAVKQSINNTIGILDKWKAKVSVAGKEDKPQMIITNCSGGGISASYWSMRVLQKLDSLTNGDFMKHTTLMSGASGGMYGTSFFRELYLTNQLADSINYYDKAHAISVAADYLNPMVFTFVVNDIFFPWQRHQVGNYSYIKDRGYSWEQKFNTQTYNLLNKPMAAYQSYEADASIPMLFMASTIMNDKRRMLFAAQPIAYLTRPAHALKNKSIELDAVEFNRLFKAQNAEGLLMSSAIRMNGSFPLIFPSVFLPSEPVIEIMDAGLVDNHGYEITYRFLYHLRNWIKENVSKVTVLDIRSYNKKEKIEDHRIKRLLQKIFTPVSVYDNWGFVQDYSHDNFAGLINEVLNDKLEIVSFEYESTKINEKVSMSLHLMEKEKQAIEKALSSKNNLESFNQLKKELL